MLDQNSLKKEFEIKAKELDEVTAKWLEVELIKIA